MRRAVNGGWSWLALAVVLTALLAAPPAHAQARPADAARARTLTSRLDNGLELVLSEARDQPVFSLAVRYRVGGRDDPAELDELAHLVEHLSFRYSKHVGRDRALVTEVPGVTSNARTADDDTVYVSSGPVSALPRVLWLERQRMAFALESLSRADVVSERRIIDNERSTVRVDRAGGMFWRFVSAELYPPQHPYAPRPERGCVLGCELRHVQWLMQRGYRPDNARLVAVGDFDADVLLASIARSFGSIDNPGVTLPPPANVPVRPGPRQITLAAPVPRPSVHLFWEIPASLRASSLGLRVLGSQLERSLENDLVHQVGLATGADVSLMRRELGWLWSVEVDLLPGVDPKLVEARILAQLARLRQRPLAIDSARLEVQSGLLQTWDDPQARAALLTSEPRGFDLAHTTATLGGVSAQDVMSLARQSLPGRPRLTVHVRRAVDADQRGELYREPE